MLRLNVHENCGMMTQTHERDPDTAAVTYNASSPHDDAEILQLTDSFLLNRAHFLILKP